MIKSLIKALFKEEKNPISNEIKSQIKGNFGELRQEIRLDRLPRENYRVINDIIIPNGNKTSQIDHLVISKFGIFVIENKNFRGNIYGKQYDKTWTQVMGQTKNTFYNPIAQNYGHIKALENIIGASYKVYSVIVFSDKSVLSKVNVEDDNIKVINEGELLTTIKSFNSNLLSDDEVRSLYNKVLESMASIRQDMSKHVKDIKDRIDESNKVCPRCSSELIKREGKYGEFLGCKSYPKCKYTYKLDK